jgi:micrococcal nuclease
MFKVESRLYVTWRALARGLVMKVKIIYAMLLIFPLIVLDVTAYRPIKDYDCIEVLDGDTLIVTRNEKVYRVRLAYIDAPEKSQKSLEGVPVGKQITAYLRKNLLGKTVQLKVLGRDIYGRLLAEVYFKGKFVNYHLVNRGLAVLYSRSRFQTRRQKREFLQAYYLAQDNRAGIWKTQGIMNPYHYRKINKKKGLRRDPDM